MVLILLRLVDIISTKTNSDALFDCNRKMQLKSIETKEL